VATAPMSSHPQYHTGNSAYKAAANETLDAVANVQNGLKTIDTDIATPPAIPAGTYRSATIRRSTHQDEHGLNLGPSTSQLGYA